ncbi:MAG: hypothetical protein V2A79_11560 [Planctomycetota bacterium]
MAGELSRGLGPAPIRTQGTRSWGKVLGIGLGVVVLGAGGVWGGRYWLGHRTENDLQAKLTAGNAQEMRDALLALDEEKLNGEEGKKALAVTAERMKSMSFSEMMDVMRSKDLTEEQRRHLREVGREVMMASVNKNVDEYFAAPKEQREALLDRQMDEWIKFREQMQAYREAHKDDPEDQAEREHWQAPTRDRQEAKERMEGGDPDQQKRMFYYFGQMRARAEARGINMWGGHGGGMGGGRGGSDSRESDRPGRSRGKED